MNNISQYNYEYDHNTTRNMTVYYLFVAAKIEACLSYWENRLEAILLYGSPVLMVLGTVGNFTAACVVVKSKALWKNNVSLYILVLAIVDTLTLYSLIGLQMLELWTNLSLMQMLIPLFLYYSLPIYEAWLLVSISVERLIAVYWPFQYPSLCTKKRTVTALATTAFVASVLAIVLIWVELNIGDDAAILSMLLLVSYLPFVIMIFTSTASIWKIVKTSKKRRACLNTQSVKVSQVTITMLVVCFVFLVLTGSGSFAVALAFSCRQYDFEACCFSYALLVYTTLVVYLNYVVNFYIYSLANPLFRKELKQIILRKKT